VGKFCPQKGIVHQPPETFGAENCSSLAFVVYEILWLQVLFGGEPDSGGKVRQRTGRLEFV